MPLTKKDRKMESNFEREYGDRGKSIYYATMNKAISKGRPYNTPESRKLAKKRRRHK